MRRLFKFLPILALLLCTTNSYAACASTNLGNGITCVHLYQKDCNSAGGTTCAQAITAVASGATLIVSGYTTTQHLGGGSNDCTTAIATTAGSNSFLNVQNSQWDTTNNLYTFTCYAKNVTNAPTTVTVTSNANIAGSFEIAIFELTGLDLTSPLDQNIIASQAGCPTTCAGSTSPSSGAATTTSANEYLFCHGVEWTSGTNWGSPTGGFAIEQQNANHSAQLDQASTSTGSFTCGATLNASVAWNMSLSTWKAAGSGAAASTIGGPSRIVGPTRIDYWIPIWKRKDLE